MISHYKSKQEQYAEELTKQAEDLIQRINEQIAWLDELDKIPERPPLRLEPLPEPKIYAITPPPYESYWVALFNKWMRTARTTSVLAS